MGDRPAAPPHQRSDGDGSLAARLGELARSLQQEHDVDATLDAIVRAAVDTVPGAQHASISVVRRRREVRTRASTSALARAVDQAQYDTGEGPCLQSLYAQQTVRLPDLAARTPWPLFVARAVDLGVGSMLAVQLFVAGDDLGALNLTAERPRRFDDESEHVALLFATHAAVAMSGALEQAQLLRALNTRDLVGQAKGVLIERFKLSADQAFTLLVKASQDTNRKLHDIADELVSTGELAAPDGTAAAR